MVAHEIRPPAILALLACLGVAAAAPATTLVFTLAPADPGLQEETVAVLFDRLAPLVPGDLQVRPEGEDRVVVSYAGGAEAGRVAALATRRAVLEVRPVLSPAEAGDLLPELDAVFRGWGADAAVEAPADPRGEPYDPLPGSPEAAAVERAALADRPFSGRLEGDQPTLQGRGQMGLVAERHLDAVRAMAGDPRAEAVLRGRVLRLAAAPEPIRGLGPGHALYLLGAETVLTADDIAEAAAERDVNLPGSWQVLVVLTPEAGAAFARATEDNLGRFLAICLDGDVMSAPRVHAPVAGGRAVIQGRFTREEAQDLACTLDSGDLPVVLSLLEVRRD